MYGVVLTATTEHPLQLHHSLIVIAVALAYYIGSNYRDRGSARVLTTSHCSPSLLPSLRGVRSAM